MRVLYKARQIASGSQAKPSPLKYPFSSVLKASYSTFCYFPTSPNMASKLAPAGSVPQLIKSDRGNMSLSSDDTMNQILATHTTGQCREVDVKPLLDVVEDILRRSTLYDGTQKENMEDKTHQAGVVPMLDSLSCSTIEKISCEMECKCLSGAEGHATILRLFNALSGYSWEAKLVLTLAAFNSKYGEFCLLCQIYSSNQLAKSLAILRQLPILREHWGSLKLRFDEINNLIRTILDMTRCIVEFKDLPYPYIYITKDLPALSTATATIPTAVYWAIKGVAVCADQIINLSTNGHNLQESSELSTLTDMISKILDHLKKQLTTCYQYIEDKKKVDALQHLFELMIHTDKMEVLKAIICPKDDQLPLLDGEKKRANLEILRKKNVSLLISGLEISQEEITELEQIYKDSKKNAYEVVWIPILEHWADSMQEQFESQQTKMPWLSVHPSFIEKPVIWFIKEKWHFRNKPILVVVDAQGKVVNPNAIHMMRIWGSNAFPFTSSKEEALWKEGVWRLELLLHGIDQTILNWVKDGKYIFLYGGDDIKWIREFTKKARNLAENADIPLQMVYLGKSAKREKVPGVIKTIRDEKLSYCWQEMMVTISFFWTRLQSMLFSKIRLGSVDDSEPMMEEIKKILSYDKSGGWAVLTKGSSVVLNGHSSTVLLALSDYDLWKKQIPEKGFDRSIKEYYDKHHGPAHPCCRFDFSSTLGWIPENMTCPECRRNMEKHFAFVCCHDESAASAQY